MSQSDDQQREDRYIRHGLALVRFGNGLAASADAQIRKLIADLRYLLSRDDISRMGKRAIAQLINDLSDVVYQRYDKVADDQSQQLAGLVPVEAEFAQKAGGFDKAASSTALAAVVSGLLLLGASIRDTWRKQAADLIYRAAAIIRSADSNDAALASLIGASKSSRAAKDAVTLKTRPPSVGGEIGSARQRAQTITHTAVSTAAQDARLAAFRSNGIRYMQWHAVLDAKVCPVCAVRADKLWTIDGEPIGHTIPLGTTPPIHWACRCLMLPLSGEPPVDGGPGLHKFDTWLATLTEAQQDDILGKGRAQLYRDGVITLGDLLNQNGQVLSLAELRATIE